MLRPRMILVIAVGLLMTFASIMLRYQVTHQPIEEEQHTIVRPRALPADNHNERIVETTVPDIGTLNLGDEVVRSLAEELSSHPKFAAWLVTDNLMRRFVQSVNLIAGGYSPRDELAFLGPKQAFVVDQEGEELLITSGSFHCYDLVTDVFASLNTRSVANTYHHIAPQARETHREISWFAPEFDVRLTEAIDHLIETPISNTALRVERQAVTYAFADPSLEALTPAQKQLLRMGPRNARRIQNKLREIRDALGLESLPPERVATNQEPDERERHRHNNGDQKRTGLRRRNDGQALTRTSHQLPATAGDAPHPAAFSRIGMLDGLSSTTPRPSGRKHCWARHLPVLATKPGEKYGLARRLRVER